MSSLGFFGLKIEPSAIFTSFRIWLLWLGTEKIYLKATSNFISDEELDTGPGPYKVFSKMGWGDGRWYVIRKSDRRVMKSSPEPRYCKRWVIDYGPKHLT